MAVNDIKVISESEIAVNLPASKTDIAALGATRSHQCACGNRSSNEGLVRQELCPACALFSIHRWALDHGASEDDPLFPTSDGEYPSKQAVVATKSFTLPPVAPSLHTSMHVVVPQFIHANQAVAMVRRLS